MSSRGESDAKARGFGHRRVEDESEEDVYEKSISESGCAAENEAVQNCYFETRDWRRCAGALAEFRACFKAKNSRDRGGDL